VPTDVPKEPAAFIFRVEDGDRRYFRNVGTFNTYFPYGFNVTVLYHITVLKFVNGCLKNALAARCLADVKLPFPGLHVHLTSLLSIFFFGDICKPKSMPL
jgi:hypothetical protein